MEAAIDVRNPIAVRRAGERVLKDTLGPDVAKAFLKISRSGDYTAEKQMLPDVTVEEIEAYGVKLMRLDTERRARENQGAEDDHKI